MGRTLYTEVCPACGEEYTVKYSADNDKFTRVTGCKCDRLADVIQQVITEISDFKADYNLNPKRHKKQNILDLLERVQLKLQTAL